MSSSAISSSLLSTFTPSNLNKDCLIRNTLTRCSLKLYTKWICQIKELQKLVKFSRDGNFLKLLSFSSNTRIMNTTYVCGIAAEESEIPWQFVFHNGYEFMTSERISLSEIEFCAVKKGRLPEKPLLWCTLSLTWSHSFLNNWSC